MAAIVEESNAERVRRAHDCFRRGDADGLAGLCTPDVEFTSFVAEMEGRVYRGPQGIRDWLANVEETFDAFSSEVAAIEELGDRWVLAEILIRATVGGLPLEQRAFQLVELRGDRASRWTWHRTIEEALAAAEEGE